MTRQPVSHTGGHDRLRFAILPLLLIALLLPAAAQSGGAGNSGNPVPEGTLIPTGIPLMMNNTQWSLLGQVAESYNDNILLSPSAPQTDALTEVAFNLGGVQQGPRWTWRFHYLPQFTFYAAHRAYNDLAQNLDQTLTWRWTRHTTVTWSASAHRYPSRSSIPGFSFGLGGPVASGSVGMQQGAVITGVDQSLGLTHAVSRHSRFSLGVTGGLEHYAKDPTVPVTAYTIFGNSFSLGVNGGWSHDVSRRVSIGLQGSYSEFQYSGSAGHSRYASLQPTLMWQLSPATSVTLGAGPAWTNLKANQWNTGYAASFSLSHRVRRSVFGAFWSRTTQLSQIQTGLQTQTWGGSYVYSLSRWNLEASFGESGTAVGQAAQPLRSRDFSTSLACQIASGWIGSVAYTYANQLESGFTPAGLSFHRNQWQFQLQHIFGGAKSATAAH